ncbi:hypothetical protein ACW9IK_07120 [Pseudomonas gingeri]
MDKLVDKLFGMAWPLICATSKDAQMLVRSDAAFFRIMKKRSDICRQGWLFGVVVAVGLGLLGLPALRWAGVKPGLDFAVVMTAMNWLLLAIYGVCFGVAARLLGSSRSMMVSINTFFYLAGWLVLLKLFEMPALGARFGAMAQSCSSYGYGQAVSIAIKHNEMAFLSDKFVGVGYVLFAFLLMRMQRGLHDFGRLRALVATVLGMVFLSAVVGYVQEPIFAQLLCGYGREL